MKLSFRKSKLILLIMIFNFLIVCFNSFFILKFINDIKNDSMAINNSGIIRGSIQRVAKLVLSNEDKNFIKKLINDIDLLFNEFETKKEYHIYLIRAC